jgi:hypothetical protein
VHEFVYFLPSLIVDAVSQNVSSFPEYEPSAGFISHPLQQWRQAGSLAAACDISHGQIPWEFKAGARSLTHSIL